MKVGDRVRLKSGGPVMVVEGLDASDAVCRYSPAPGKLRYERFAQATLEPARSWRAP